MARKKKLKAKRVRPVGRPQGRKKTSKKELTLGIEDELKEVWRLTNVFGGKKKKKGWFF